MKKVMMSLTTILLLGSTLTFGQNKSGKQEATIKVWGNCGMCESKIEGAAKGLKGVKSADWNRETKMITVVYDSSKVSLEEVSSAIAGVGYDTESHRAEDEVYQNLPGCCQYEREKEEK